MAKEGSRSFLFDSQGRISIAFVLSIVFMFGMMVLIANAMTITLRSPGNLTYNGSRNINFTFVPVWQNDAENVSNCSIYVNNTAVNTGVWNNVVNFSAMNDSVDAKIVNNSLSYANFTFSSDGNFTFNIGCFDANVTQTVRNLSNESINRSFFIDIVAPQVSPILPWGTWIDGGVLNITSYDNATIYVNVTDNSTRSVYFILFDKDSTVASRASSASGSTNESANRTMKYNVTLSHDKSVYKFNLSGLFNITNNFTGPGAKSIVFCANDSLGRLTCSGKKDILISGTNITTLTQGFNDMAYSNPDSTGGSGFSFGGVNVTYGNGSVIPKDSFMNPLSINLTLIINFSGTPDTKIFIVGARIDEAQLGNISRTNFSDTMTTQAQQELGSGFKSNITFVDIASFIPSSVSYEYGIILLPNKFNRKLYCSGTSISNPGCSQISPCNATAIGLYNHSSIIPTDSACWIDSGGFGLGGLNNSEYTLSTSFTYIFVDHFSGGLGANDFSRPNVTMNTPALSITNSSSALTQSINFTLNDIASTGFNLSINTSINLTITQGGTIVKRFNYTNSSNSGDSSLTCITSDTTSPENTTSVTCNATYIFNSNGSYLIHINASDSSNNSNPVTNDAINVSSFTVIIDHIPPKLWNFTISSSSAVDGTEYLGGLTPATILSGGTFAQGRRFFAFANVSDNLTRPFHATLQFFNISANSGSGAWQTINTTTDYTEINITNSATSVNSTANLSFVIPTGHNEFEGMNVSFRIIVNDTLGNVNSSASVVNITININDTTAPAVSINGTFTVNGSNITTTTPTIGFAVNEPHALSFINISIDSNQTIFNAPGKDTLCQKAAFYDLTSGVSVNVESNRNNSITVSSDAGCPLINGKHNVSVTAKDQWGNTQIYHFDFNVQSGTQPGLKFNLSNAQIGAWSKSAINNSNITSSVGIGLSGFAGATGTIDRISYTSSCDSTTVVVTNNTVVYPFNGTCATASANRTLTVTINDTAGNSNTTVLGFLVDNVAPTLTAHSPKDGQTFTNVEVVINLSAKDNNQAIASFGYYLDSSNDPIAFNLSNTGSIGSAGVNVTRFTLNATTNLTGIHTIKLTANDSIGNGVNSSVITFSLIGPIDFLGANLTIKSTNNNNMSNVSFINGSDVLITGTTNADQTLKLFMALNTTGDGDRGGANVTVNFNGTAANWNKTTQIYLWLNDSTSAKHIISNQTATVINSIFVNRSFVDFLPDNNSYFGQIRMSVPNASRFGNKVELWYFADESDLATKTNITQCSASLALTHSLTSGLPCWNATSARNNLSVDIFVPHFSLIALVNNSGSAWVNVTTPSATNQTVSMFVPNITVGPDTATCNYQVNGSTPQTMVKSGNICLGSTERFKSRNAPDYNITFNVTDSSGNLNSYLWKFNVSDTTSPNAPNSSRVSTSVTSSTAATITISSINESVNATVYYGTTAGVLSSSAVQTDFNQTQAVSLSGLAEGTLHYFNVTVCDYNGNCQINGTFNFTTSAAAATSSSTSDSSSSGGGGATTTVTDVAASKAQVWGTIAAGASVSIDVNKETIAITSVAVNEAKSALSNVELEVAALTKNPVSTEAAAKVYQYLRITKKNIADSDAGSFKITFRVPNSWLTSNSLTAGDVALYRFADSAWNELAAKVTGTDATYTNYEADTPGFSSFAVGAKTGAKVEEKAPGETPTVPGEAPKEEVPIPVEKPKPVEAPKKAPIAWVIAAVVVILGIILIVAYQKKKQQ